MQNNLSSLPLPRHVSQRAIAKQAGVSTSTVSRVLNNVEGISDELRGHVLRVATGMGYLHPGVPDRLRYLHLLTISFEARNTLHTFHTSILDGVAAECQQNGILLNYSVVEASPVGRMAVLAMAKERPGTSMLLMSIDDRALIQALLALKVPLALLNAEQRDLPVDTFLPDNFTSSLLATRHLLTQGHRRILHVNEPTSKRRPTLQQRLYGYQAALEEAGIPYDPALVLETPLRVDETHQAMRNRLAAGKRPAFTAAFCANDASAIGAMRALQEAGRKVPEDISLIGHDDVPAASLLTPALTTFHIDCEEMGRLAVQRMMYRMLRPEAAPTRVEIASRLIERQSVAACSTRE